MDDGGESRPTERCRSVTFHPESDWAFDHVVESLCNLTAAVTLAMTDGREVDAVLVAIADGILTFEGWDREAGQPDGGPHTVEVTDVATIHVF